MGSASSALLNYPEGVFCDANGNLYIVDTGNNVIRKLDVTTGLLSIIAGTGSAGFNGDNLDANSSQLNQPTGGVADAAGNIYIVDNGNNLVRKVDAISRVMSIVAGGGSNPGNDGFGDGGPARLAELNGPSDIAVDGSGNLYVSDTFNGLVRKIAVSTGAITLVAGGGSNQGTDGLGDGGPAISAQFSYPTGLALDSAGNLYIADTYDHLVRKVDFSTGVVTAVAGNSNAGFAGDGGLAVNAQLDAPFSLALDQAGDIFIADSNNSKIRRVDVGSGLITSIAGSNVAGFSGSPGQADKSELNYPYGLALDSNGLLYIADTVNNLLRRVDLVGFPIVFASQAVQSTSSAQTLSLSNGGTASLAINSITLGGSNAADFAQSTTCGTVLAAGASCSVSVNFTPQSAGSRSALLTISDSAANSPQTVTLSGTGQGVAQGNLSSASLVFASQAVQSTSSAQTLSLSNGGTASLAINSITLGGSNAADFAQSTTCGTVLAAGASCSVSVNFTPQSAGSRSALLTISDSAANSPQTVTLSGTGQGVAQGNLSSASLVFASQAVQSTSSAQTLSLSNGGTASLAINSITLGGSNAADFAQSTTCGTVLAAGASCSVSVNFTPQSAGSRSALLTISDSAANSPQTVTLSGTGQGVAQGNLSSASLVFASQAVQSTSSAQTLSLSNGGTASLAINSITLGGSNAADFAQSTTCGTVLAAGASCSVSVNFTPQSAGSRSALLTISDSAANSPQTVTLSGTGQGVAQGNLSSASLVFASQAVQSTSSAQTLSLSNGGTASLAINSITLGGSNAADFAQSTTCGTVLAAGASCSVSVNFTPQSAGSRSALLTISDSAANSPQTVTLSGTGQGVAQGNLSSASLVFASQAVQSTSSAQTLSLSNGGTASLAINSITLGGSNAADFAQSTTCGTVLAAGASCSVSVNFTPQSAGSRSALLTISDSAANSPQTVTLSGTGQGVAQGNLSSASLVFASQAVQSTSSAQTLSLSNGGTASLAINSITLGGSNAADFAQSTTCGTVLAAGASCSVSVNFTPQSAGSRSALLTISDSAANSPQTVTLSGTGQGVAQGNLSSASLVFASQAVQSTSSAQTLSLSNGGTASLAINSITLGGSNAADFAQSTTCGTVLAAGASCSVSVNFTPQSAGSRSALLTISDSAANSPQTVTLSGTGQGVAQGNLSSASLVFASQAVQSTSSAQTLSLSNGGTASLAINSITLGGSNAADFAQSTTCGTVLAAGASCSVSVNFTPQSAGSRSALLTISDSAANSPQTVTLSGTGQGVAQGNLSSASLVFASQAVQSTSSAQTLSLSNGGTASLAINSITLGGSNAADFAQSTTCGTVLAAGASCSVSVNFTPQSAGSRSALLTISDSAANSPQTVTLSGTGGYPIPRLVFAHVASDIEWQTELVISNPTTSNALYSLTFHTDTGLPMMLLDAPSTTNLILYPKGTAVFHTNSSSPNNGWAEVISDVPLKGVAVFQRHSQLDGKYYEGSVLLSSPTTTFSAPFDESLSDLGTSFLTALAVSNADPNQSALVSCTGYDSDGNTIASSIALPTLRPSQHLSFLLDSLFPTGFSNSRGTLQCSSNTAIAAVELRAYDPQKSPAVSSVPVTSSPQASNTVLIFPHVASDIEWQTSIVITNSNSQPAIFTLNLKTDSGQPLLLNGNPATQNVVIPAHGSIKYQTLPSMTANNGWAQLVSANQLSGVAIFERHAAADGKYYEGSVPGTISYSSFTAPFDQTQSLIGIPFLTAIALANPTISQSASISCTAYDQTGNILIPDFVLPSLPPGGHSSFLMNDVFPSVLINKQGIIRCSATVEIAAVIIRALDGSPAVSSMPVFAEQ